MRSQLRVPSLSSPRATSRAELAEKIHRARRSSRAKAVLRLACGLVIAILATPTRAELVVVEQDVPGEGLLTTFKMTVTPAAEPVPALKHRLMLREIELKQGNAAPYYYRSLLNIQNFSQKLRKKYGDAYDEWYRQNDVALEELPFEKAQAASDSWRGSAMENLREATRRRHCNWQWNVEEIRGPEIVAFLLEEIQVSRELCRGLMLVARVDLANGDYEKVLDTLRMNYRLGHDVGKAPFLVSDLVGIAICGMGNNQLIELIAQKDSPNLYWAIAELPDPMVSIQDSMRAEMSNGLRIFPFILDAETAEHSPEEWARLMAKALVESQQLVSSGVGQNVVPSSMTARFAVTAMSTVAYPAAKQRLIESGMTKAQVEAMPVGKVVSIDALREYRRIADSIEKWSYVPARVLRNHNFEINKELNVNSAEGLSRGFGHTLASLLLPAMQAARSAEQRLIWQTHGIQTVEAIRMHAAETGKLPNSLDEITIVPLPRNPRTDKPYEYELEGETAIVKLPFEDDFPGVAYRFEVTLEE
ncbi:MAG: hypothetical protein RH917_03580 [Lacipirellulaceae bacterium]